MLKNTKGISRKREKKQPTMIIIIEKCVDKYLICRVTAMNKLKSKHSCHLFFCGVREQCTAFVFVPFINTRCGDRKHTVKG